MFATKYLVLLFVPAVVYSASYADCTKRTYKQAKVVDSYIKNELKLPLTFDCRCAERAEGLAWVAALGVTTQDYSSYYHIYNMTQVEQQDQLKDGQLKSMLEALVEANPQMKTHTGVRYGCASSPGKKEGNNVTHALTCVFAKTAGQCLH